MKPLFMDPADLVQAWKKAIASNPDMPATPTVKVRTPVTRADPLRRGYSVLSAALWVGTRICLIGLVVV